MWKTSVAALALLTAGTAQAQGAADADDRPWTLSVSGGITAIQAQTDQPFVGMGISRRFDDSWVKLEAAWVGSGDARGSTIPADTLIATFSAGTYIGNLGLDAYVLGGPRRFDAARFRAQNGTMLVIDRSGSLFGIGGGISYDVAVADRLFLTPFASVDYTQIDFSTATFGPNGRPIGAQQQSSDGVTGSAGVSLAHLFANDGGSIGVSAAFNTASNIAAIGQIGRATRTGNGPPRFANTPDEGGSWAELGGTLSFNLSENVAADLSLVQTISFPFGDATAGTLGLRFRF
jgi:hypothetical protein